MNGVLFRRSARSLWKTWVVFAAVLSLYVSMITAMFDPKLNATLDEIVTAMPQLMNMVGMQAGSSSLGGFLINYLYGFLLLLLPLVFSILAANRLVARWVDTGSMAYLLASPNTRARVARTQALVLIAGGTLLTAYCTALAVGCAVLGNEELTVGLVDEIELSGGFFNFEEKYTLKTSAIHCPARIPQEKAAEIQAAAKVIYRALDCRVFARVDLFLTPEGKIVFNEVNTIPGFTSHSRYPTMMKGIGLDFSALVDQIITLGVTG